MNCVCPFRKADVVGIRPANRVLDALALRVIARAEVMHGQGVEGGMGASCHESERATDPDGAHPGSRAVAVGAVHPGTGRQI